MPMRASIRVRLTLWYVLLMAVILAVFSAGVFFLLRHSLYRNLDQSIQSRAFALVEMIQYGDDGPYLASQGYSSDPNQGEHFARVFDSSGGLRSDSSVAIGDIPIDGAAVLRSLAGESTSRRGSIGEDGDSVRVITFPIRRGGEIVGVIEVGQSEEDVSETLATLLLLMGLAYPVTLVVAGLGGTFLAGRALSPVDRITRLARRLSAQDLGQRLNLALPDDEVGRLARTFDEMIARLDNAFRRQRQFTADASHELRTPLTIMKGQIDVSLQKDREPEAYRQVLQAVNEEVDRLVRLVGSLLNLTRADAGEIRRSFERVDFASAVAGAVQQVRATALQRGVEVESAPDLAAGAIPADEDLLLQLLLNLLDNAVKYTSSGGHVTVGWSVRDEWAELWVRDTGIGIPKEHIPHLFDRFYRVDKARSRAEGGVGLGLAISRWIAEAHGGSIRVESAPGMGSTFTVLLPTKR